MYIKKKGRVYEFSEKVKFDIADFWEQKEIFFNTQTS